MLPHSQEDYIVERSSPLIGSEGTVRLIWFQITLEWELTRNEASSGLLRKSRKRCTQQQSDKTDTAPPEIVVWMRSVAHLVVLCAFAQRPLVPEHAC